MDISALFHLALFAGALLLLAFSTYQWRWPVRLSLWAGGVALLAVTIYSVTRERENYGLWRAFGDLWVHRHNPTESVLFLALQRNLGTLPNYASPLLDIGLIIAMGLALLALLSLSRGTVLERVTGAGLLVLTGAVVGALTSLGLVALGFGGEAQRTELVGYIASEADVHDGDTFWLGGISVRLFGVDAPELRQTCDSNAVRSPCGQVARDYLYHLLAGSLVHCTVQTKESGRLMESFGRPIAICRATPTGQSGGQADATFDVGQRMVSDGYAFIYEKPNTTFGLTAPALGAGYHLGCTLRPDVWRKDHQAWEESRAITDPVLQVGPCSAVP
jgi:endonuclease YncB( thermonuclease family)